MTFESCDFERVINIYLEINYIIKSNVKVKLSLNIKCIFFFETN